MIKKGSRVLIIKGEFEGMSGMVLHCVPGQEFLTVRGDNGRYFFVKEDGLKEIIDEDKA